MTASRAPQQTSGLPAAGRQGVDGGLVDYGISFIPVLAEVANDGDTAFADRVAEGSTVPFPDGIPGMPRPDRSTRIRS